MHLSWEDNLGAAKAVAQSDYERRILSALQPIPVTVQQAALVEALEDVTNPMHYARKQAEAEGNVLNGAAAVSITNDPEFIKDIAKNALRALSQSANN